MVERKRGDNEGNNNRIRQRKENRIEKKVKELQKHYPNNKYEVQEAIVKGDHKVLNIIRTEGKKPHRTKTLKTGVK